MTDIEYENLKKRLQNAAYVKGKITTAKKEIARYTLMEEESINFAKKDYAHNKILIWIGKLSGLRKKYEAI